MMKYISLDLETTGLKVEKDQILEIGIVAVDHNISPTKWKTFHAIIDHERIEGDVYALTLNNRILKILVNNRTFKNNDYIILKPEELLPAFLNFLNESGYKMKDEHYTISIAGKNPGGFDLPMLKYHFNRYNNTKFDETNDMPSDSSKPIRFRKRIIDPSMLYIDFLKDSIPPDLKTCKERAGLENIITHNALEDALDVVYTICAKIGFNFNDIITEKKLNNEFEIIDYNSNLNFNRNYHFWSIKDTEIILVVKMKIQNQKIYLIDLKFIILIQMNGNIFGICKKFIKLLNLQ